MPAATRTATGSWIDLGTDPSPDEPGGPHRTKVLVPIDSADSAATLIRTAAAFARRSRSEVLALHVTWVPPQLPLSEAGRFRARSRGVVQAVQRMREHVLDVPIRIVLTAGRRTDDVIVAATQRDDVPSAIVPWEPDDRALGTRGRINAERVLRGAGCHMLAIRHDARVEIPARIVVPVRPHNPDVSTVTPAAALARRHGVSVLLLTVLHDDVDRAAEIEARMWLTRLEGDLTEAGIPHHAVQRAVLIGEHLGTALAEHTERDDLVLLGAPSGLRMFCRSRIRRLRRRIAEVERTIAVYQPQRPTPLVQRLFDRMRGTDETGQRA